MNKKGKILTGIIVGCLGATMLTSCSLSAEQNTNIDSMLNKGDALIDSLGDSLDKSNSLIDKLDEKLNYLNTSNISKDEAIVTLQNALFNLNYRVNGCEIIESNLTITEKITNQEYFLKQISDTSTEIKKQYFYGPGKIEPDEKPQTIIYNYNTIDNTGYTYYEEMKKFEKLTDINTFYTDFIFWGTPNLEAIKDNITKAEKVNDEYCISIFETMGVTEHKPFKNTHNYTIKIKDNKIMNIEVFSITEPLNTEYDYESYNIKSIFIYNQEYKYGSEVDLETLNDAITNASAKIEGAELLNEVKDNLVNCTNGFEKFEINATTTTYSDQSDETTTEYHVVTDFSGDIKAIYREDYIDNDKTYIYAFKYNTDSQSGYTYSNFNSYEELYKTTSEEDHTPFTLHFGITANNILEVTKDGDTYIIKTKLTGASQTDNDSYERTTILATYEIKDNKFTKVSFNITFQTGDAFSDEVDEFGNAYLENITSDKEGSMSVEFNYEDINLEFLNDGLKAIDDKIESGDLEYSTSNN